MIFDPIAAVCAAGFCRRQLFLFHIFPYVASHNINNFDWQEQMKHRFQLVQAIKFILNFLY